MRQQCGRILANYTLESPVALQQVAPSLTCFNWREICRDRVGDLRGEEVKH